MNFEGKTFDMLSFNKFGSMAANNLKDYKQMNFFKRKSGPKFYQKAQVNRNIGANTSISSTDLTKFQRERRAEIRARLPERRSRGGYGLQQSFVSFGQNNNKTKSHEQPILGLKPVIVYEKIKDCNAEIGLVDVQIRDLRDLSFVSTQLKVDHKSLEKICELLNHPGSIQEEDHKELITFIEKMSSLKSNEFNKVFNDLKKIKLLTETGMETLSGLLSSSEGVLFLKYLKARGKTLKSSMKEETTTKATALSNGPFNKNFLPGLSFILEKVRIKRPLTDAEEQRLGSFIGSLVQMPDNILWKNFAMYLKNDFLTTRQLETLIELMPHYNKTQSYNGFLIKSNILHPTNCKDLSNLLSIWPNLRQSDFKRLDKYLKILANMEALERKDFLGTMKTLGYLNHTKMKLLSSLIESQSLTHDTRLLF